MAPQLFVFFVPQRFVSRHLSTEKPKRILGSGQKLAPHHLRPTSPNRREWPEIWPPPLFDGRDTIRKPMRVWPVTWPPQSHLCKPPVAHLPSADTIRKPTRVWPVTWPPNPICASLPSLTYPQSTPFESQRRVWPVTWPPQLQFYKPLVAHFSAAPPAVLLSFRHVPPTLLRKGA